MVNSGTMVSKSRALKTDVFWSVSSTKLSNFLLKGPNRVVVWFQSACSRRRAVRTRVGTKPLASPSTALTTHVSARMTNHSPPPISIVLWGVQVSETWRHNKPPIIRANCVSFIFTCNFRSSALKGRKQHKSSKKILSCCLGSSRSLNSHKNTN